MALHNGLDTREEANTLNLHHDAILDVDDVVTQNATQENKQTDNHGSKLAHAKEVGKKTVTELQALCEGLDSRISEIGIVVEQAQTYQGSEKFFSFLGKVGIKSAKDKAAVMRHERLQKLDLKQAVQEIQNYTVATINELGETETEYKMDLNMYQTKLTEILNKQTVATPKYLAAVAAREALDAKVQAAQEELNSGTVAQAARPAKEAQLEILERQQHAAQLEETSLLSIVKQAKDGIPILQKDRDAAAKAIQAVHGMRQDMFEKFNNLKVVLERATTALKANARLELYSSVDPAFNKAIETITANNIATAGASLEVWAERMKHAAIDPQKSQELLQELLGHISDYAQDLQSVEDNVKNRKPTPKAEPKNDSELSN